MCLDSTLELFVRGDARLKRKAHSKEMQEDRLKSVPTKKKLGAEEDGFALEHFDGDKEGGRSIDARGKKNDGDVIPVVGAGDEFFAEEADVQNRDERKLGSQLHAGKHGGDGGNDDDKGHRREITLRFFISLGEERDGHERCGEKDGHGKSHEEDGNHRLGSELEEKFGSSGAAAGRL